MQGIQNLAQWVVQMSETLVNTLAGSYGDASARRAARQVQVTTVPLRPLA
jgi:hypothetical protein